MSFCRDPSSHRPQSVRVRRRGRNNEVDKVRQDTTLLMTPNPGGANLLRAGRRAGLNVPKEYLFAMGVMTSAFQGGGLMFGFSAFANVIKDKSALPGTPFTTDNVTSIFTIGHNIAAWGCIISGFLLDTYGPRVCAVSGLLIEAAGHGLMSQVVYMPPEVTYLAFGLMGLGGCQVLLAALTFTDAFANSGLTSAILTAAFQAGGFVFMILPYVQWDIFFKSYVVFCLAMASATALVYPDSPLTSYQAAVEHSEIAEFSAAIANRRTLKQVLIRPGTLGFMITFMVAGSALTYGIGEFVAALKDKDDCVWNQTTRDFDHCPHQDLQDSLNNVWMPLVGNFIIPCSLVLGKLVDTTGFGLAAFINIFFVQAFIAALWLFPMNAQYATLLIYNVANTAVFTVQNAYICSIGHQHIGSLFSISNGVLGLGNLLADWLTLNPFGKDDKKISESLWVSCVIWLVICTPLYFWVIVEERRRRKKQAGFESFVQQASILGGSRAGSLGSRGSLPSSSRSSLHRGPARQRSGSGGRRSRGDGSWRSEGTAGREARRIDIGDANGERPLLSVQQTGDPRQTTGVITSVLNAFGGLGVGQASAGGNGNRRQPAPSNNVVLTINPTAWEAKTSKLVEAGANKVFCVFDFDRTVTKCFLENGDRSLDCHDILASIPKITRECKHTMEEMMEYYYPIEIHPTMSRENKVPHMVEWYAKVNYLLGTQNLTRDDVVEAVAGCYDFRLRAGVEEVFGILAKKNIPIIIVSAGLGNVIEEVIRQHIAQPDGTSGEPWPNVRVLSNTMLWDEDGNFVEFSEPLIHMYNKSLQDAPADLKEMIKGRHIGILCGDGLGDLTMAHGHDATDVLKFGFLNEKIEDRMPKYIAPEQGFDRVILNDGDWKPVLELVNRL